MPKSDPRPPLKPIPVFTSREAEAEFWDTHDLTDYFAFDQPVDIQIQFEPSVQKIELFVDWETLDLVRAMATEQALPWKALLEIWLVERRDAEQAKRRAESNEPQRESA